MMKKTRWPDNSRVFLGNLSSQVSERTIQEIFGKYGSIMELVLHETYGFVQFGDPETASIAINNEQNLILADRKISVRLSNNLSDAKKINSHGNIRHPKKNNSNFIVGKSEQSDFPSHKDISSFQDVYDQQSMSYSSVMDRDYSNNNGRNNSDFSDFYSERHKYNTQRDRFNEQNDKSMESYNYRVKDNRRNSKSSDRSSKTFYDSYRRRRNSRSKSRSRQRSDYHEIPNRYSTNHLRYDSPSPSRSSKKRRYYSTDCQIIHYREQSRYVEYIKDLFGKHAIKTKSICLSPKENIPYHINKLISEKVPFACVVNSYDEKTSKTSLSLLMKKPVKDLLHISLNEAIDILIIEMDLKRVPRMPYPNVTLPGQQFPSPVKNANDPEISTLKDINTSLKRILAETSSDHRKEPVPLNSTHRYPSYNPESQVYPPINPPYSQPSTSFPIQTRQGTVLDPRTNQSNMHHPSLSSNDYRDQGNHFMYPPMLQHNPHSHMIPSRPVAPQFISGMSNQNLNPMHQSRRPKPQLNMLTNNSFQCPPESSAMQYQHGQSQIPKYNSYDYNAPIGPKSVNSNDYNNPPSLQSSNSNDDNGMVDQMKMSRLKELLSYYRTSKPNMFDNNE